MALLEFLDNMSDIVFGNKRFNELKHFANSQGFQLRRKVKFNQLHADVKAMQFFQGEKRKTIKGYLYKKNLRFDSLNQIFDFYYVSDYGTTTTTVYMFLTDQLDLPTFIIKPRSGISKLGNIFSTSEWSDVNREFDKSYSVESNNMNFMRMMITFQFAELLLGLKNVTIEGRGNYLALYRKNSKTNIIEMDNLHDSGMELLDIIITDNSKEMY